MTRSRKIATKRPLAAESPELADLLNLGAVSAGWLEAAGIHTPAELRALGAVAAFRRVAMHRGGAGVTYNLLYALEGALRGVRWDRLPVALREELKRAADAPHTSGGGIVLAPHSAGWAAAFDDEASAIRTALSGLPIELHHVGSTAIPGIVAKPVIDMLGVVPGIEELDAWAHRLVMSGYEALGEYGIPGRRYFRKNAPDGSRTHQLHVFAAGSPEIARHLNFRDYLRAFPAEAAAYAALKQDLVRRYGNDMRAYSDGKTAFIQTIERRAVAWRQR